MSSNSDGVPVATPDTNHQTRDPQSSNRNRGRNRTGGGNPKVKTRFEGEIQELKDHVYDVGANCSPTEDFHRTTLKIAEYISRMKDGGAGEF